MITNPVKNTITKQILEGVNILLKYNSDADFDALDEQIFFGKWGQGKQEIEVSKEDEVILKDLGWFFDTEFETWSHYV